MQNSILIRLVKNIFPEIDNTTWKIILVAMVYVFVYVLIMINL